MKDEREKKKVVSQKTFEDILCWQRSRDFCLRIYALFSTNKDYSFKDQISRASLSVMNNIAEGFERRTQNEFRQFLFIAKGSCGEVRSMLYVAHELKYLSEPQFDELHKEATEISKMLSGLIRTL